MSPRICGFAICGLKKKIFAPTSADYRYRGPLNLSISLLLSEEAPPPSPKGWDKIRSQDIPNTISDSNNFDIHFIVVAATIGILFMNERSKD
jgi:hypothetical protein